jgi:hypothetical protein
MCFGETWRSRFNCEAATDPTAITVWLTAALSRVRKREKGITVELIGAADGIPAGFFLRVPRSGRKVRRRSSCEA